MFTDAIGDELIYWPITGLAAGETSEELVFNVPTPLSNGFLGATQDPRLIVWCRPTETGAYQDIGSNPIDLSAFAGPDTEFQAYVEALSPISGLERVPIAVTAGSSSPAGWKS